MYHRLCQLPRVTVANNALAEVFKKEKAQLELITVRFTVQQLALFGEDCLFAGTPVVIDETTQRLIAGRSEAGLMPMLLTPPGLRPLGGLPRWH